MNNQENRRKDSSANSPNSIAFNIEDKPITVSNAMPGFMLVMAFVGE